MIEVRQLRLDGVLEITPRRFGDARGFFCQTCNAARFAEAGIGTVFVQDNRCCSARKGVRGLHPRHPARRAEESRCGPDHLRSSRRQAAEAVRGLIAFVNDRPGHDRRHVLDPYRIERELGWKASETFDAGLAKAVGWFLANEWRWAPVRRHRYWGMRPGGASRGTA